MSVPGAIIALWTLAPFLIRAPSITTHLVSLALDSIRAPEEITQESTSPKIIAPWLAMEELIEASLPKYCGKEYVSSV